MAAWAFACLAGFRGKLTHLLMHFIKYQHVSCSCSLRVRGPDESPEDRNHPHTCAGHLCSRERCGNMMSASVANVFSSVKKEKNEHAASSVCGGSSLS